LGNATRRESTSSARKGKPLTGRALLAVAVRGDGERGCRGGLKRKLGRFGAEENGRGRERER